MWTFQHVSKHAKAPDMRLTLIREVEKYNIVYCFNTIRICESLHISISVVLLSLLLMLMVLLLMLMILTLL